MADIVPFLGIRYDPVRVGDLSRVLAPPYDVIGEAERAALEARHPQNVVRIELPRGEGDARYAEAARLLGDWMAEGVLRADPKPAFYVYEQQFTLPQAAGRIYTRRGFFAAVRLEPFERRVILPHEKTLAGPKEDRLKLMRATRTQISPIFGLFRDADGGAREIIDGATAASAALDATTADGVRHRLWRLGDPAAIAGLVRLLADKQILIADGHHRYETLLRARSRAARARLRGRGRGGRLRDDVPGARRGSGVAGAANASAGARSARLRLRGAVRGGGRGLRHRRGGRSHGAGDRGATRARGDGGRGVRGARAGTGRDDLVHAQVVRRSAPRWGRRRCASWT